MAAGLFAPHRAGGGLPVNGSFSLMRSVVTALSATAAVLLWQVLVVHFEYHGNWSGLYCTGGRRAQPPALAAENIYVFPNSTGFDGQFYHYMAHDPFFQRDLARYIDAPQMRYRRILVPLAAHALAFGRSELVDYAYIGVVLASVFLGSYWLSAFLTLNGVGAAWGWTFVLIPGVLISIDRMTVDIALLALSVGFALFFALGAPRQLYATLVAAPLVRETGLLLVAGCVFYLAVRRRWREAVLFSTTAIPTAAWYVYVVFHTVSHPEAHWFHGVPLSLLVLRLMHPVQYALPPAEALTAMALDYVALAGLIWAMGISYTMVRRLKAGPVETSLLLFGLLATFLTSEGVWRDTYGFERSFAPLPLFAALDGVRRRKWMNVLPLLLMVPRVALQLAPHAIAVLRGLTGS